MTIASATQAPIQHDFTQYNCAFNQEIKLEDYPLIVQPIVKNMRWLCVTTIAIDRSSPLGSGIHGSVYRGSYYNELNTRIFCAIKIHQNPYTCNNEANMLWQTAGVSHAIRLHGVGRSECPVIDHPNILILDYIEDANLWTLPPDTFTKKTIITIAKQLFEYLDQLKTPTGHRKDIIIHGDLKPQNLLFKNNELTVIDLAASSEKKQIFNPITISEAYRPPEIYLNQLSELNEQTIDAPRYSESIDMWSAAVIIHELTIEKPFFPYKFNSNYGLSEIANFSHRIGPAPDDYLSKAVSTHKFYNKQKRADSTETFSEKPVLWLIPRQPTLAESHVGCKKSSLLLLDLLQRILCWDPATRLTPKQALEHPLFAENNPNHPSNPEI